MSKDKDDQQKAIRNANMIGAGQKMNIPVNEQGQQQNFTKAAEQRPERANFKPQDKSWSQHAIDTTKKK